VAARVADTNLRCKLCAHPKRAEIDALLELRSKREMNLGQVLEKLTELGVKNPNVDNIKGHLGQKGNKPHTTFVADEEKAKDDAVDEALKEAALEIFERVMGADWRERTPTPDQVLEIQRALYLHKLELELREGKLPDITHDQVLKNIGEGTKRKHNEAQAELLKGLGSAAGAFASRLLEPAVIDGEAIEEAEVRELPVPECVCAETSTRNCPVHGNGDGEH